MKNLLFILICSLAIFGCTKYIDFEGEYKESKIVVNGLICDNKSVTVHISKSLNVLDDGNLNVIENATVKLYDGNDNFIENLLPMSDSVFNNNEGFYVGSELLTNNSEYKIEVEAPNYTSVSSTTRIPQYNLTQFSSVDTVTTDGDLEYSEPRTNFTFHFSDQESESNYYGIKAFGITYVGDVNVIYDLSSEDIISTNENGNEILFTDQFFNGQTHDLSIKMSTTNYSYFSDTTSNFNSKFDSIRFVFNSYSRDMFLYKKSYSDYQNVIEFFSQPVQVYSNVDEGLGVFGGLKEDTFTIKIE